jgi:hypothetical protein
MLFSFKDKFFFKKKAIRLFIWNVFDFLIDLHKRFFKFTSYFKRDTYKLDIVFQ